MLRTIGAIITAAALLVATGCGSKEAHVASTAFSKPVERATLAMNVSASVGGSNLGLSLQGPYSSNGAGKVPTVDWRLRIQGPSASPIELRLLSDGTNAFVEYRGQTYEVGKDRVAKALQQQAGAKQPFDVTALLKKARGWFPDTSTQDDAKLDGEAVTRVTGKLDAAKALRGLADLSQSAGSSTGTSGLGVDPEQIARFVSDPHFTLDAAKSDGTLRRLAATMGLQGVPGGGRISFSVQLSDVGKPVSVQLPSSGRPIEELVQQLGPVFGGVASSVS